MDISGCGWVFFGLTLFNLSPIHTADADATKLFCRVASASAVCT